LDKIVNTRISNAQNQLDSTFVSSNNGEKNNNNLAFDLSYEHRLKKPGSKVSLNAHYTRFDETSEQQLLTSYFDASNTFLRDFGFLTNAEQQIDIYTGQLDFSTPLGTAGNRG